MVPKNMSRHWHHESKDHILPKARGGTLFIHDDVRNWRIICQRCNGLLAAAGECLGALAAVRSVPGDDVTTMRLWGFGPLAQAILTEDQKAQRKVLDAAIDRACEPLRSPVLSHDYLYPADTAAKRVWNLAVLASVGAA